MATKRLDIPLGPNGALDSSVFMDLVSNQITAAASPSVGDTLKPVLVGGGGDVGWKDDFRIPKEYVGSPKIIVRGILDGAPGAADTLGFGFRKRAVAGNESADGTFDAEQTVSTTIGSGGSNYADEDEFELSITLTAGDYVVDDSVYFYFYLDDSGTTYTGNALISAILFEFADA
jgi:hypothetical protein